MASEQTSKRILLTGGKGFYEEKRSRFLGESFPVENEEDALCVIAGMKKKYYDARHNCYAFIVNGVNRSSDDGEPSGTAGRPILSVLEGEGIDSVLVVVTRYFGGVLLGGGGLVRAYTAAAKDAIAHSETAVLKLCCRVRASVDYAAFEKIRRLSDRSGFSISGVEYSEDVAFTATGVSGTGDIIRRSLSDLTGGKAVILPEEENVWIREKE